MDEFIEAIIFPSGWPLWARRTFLLTLPISGPIFLCVLFCLSTYYVLRLPVEGIVWLFGLWRVRR